MPETLLQLECSDSTVESAGIDFHPGGIHITTAPNSRFSLQPSREFVVTTTSATDVVVRTVPTTIELLTTIEELKQENKKLREEVDRLAKDASFFRDELEWLRARMGLELVEIDDDESKTPTFTPVPPAEAEDGNVYPWEEQ